MSWKRLVPVIVALMLAIPTVLVVSPAAVAQDKVPTAPTVEWVPQINNVQRLHIRFGDAVDAVGNQPVCDERSLTHAPAKESANNPRASCTFPATSAADSTLTFQTPFEVNRDVTVVGNDSLLYVHEGAVPDGVRLQVEVVSTGTLAKGTIIGGVDNTESDGDGEDDDNVYPMRLILEGVEGRQVIRKDQPLRLVIRPSGDPDVANAEITQPTFDLSDTGSRLEIRSVNGLRAATWSANEKGEVTTLFHPIDNRTDKGPRIVGFFALQSAFGRFDANHPDNPDASAPRFSLIYDGEPYQINVGGDTTIRGVYNASASVEENGTVVWSFPTTQLDYRGFHTGKYELKVDATYWQGDAVARGVTHFIHIADQVARLQPFSDAATGFAETQGHQVQPSGTTTYLLELNNTGSVNDTFRINVSAPTGAVGWSASVGGPDVRGRLIDLEPGESGLVTVTVTAPFAAAPGSQGIHLVNATSMLDPSARSLDLTLVTTVSNEVRRELGVIVLDDAVELEPGVHEDMPVYVWNRGTVPQNVTFEIQTTPQAGWEIAFRDAGASVGRMLLSNLRAGDIAEVTLRARGPVENTVQDQSITLNATSEDVNGVAIDRVVDFTLGTFAAAELKVLTHIGGAGHVAEMSGDPVAVDNPSGGQTAVDPCPPDEECPDDGIDGVWYRAWLTNTGKQEDTFQLRADSYSTNVAARECGPDARKHDPYVPREMDANTDFTFWVRVPGGQPSKVTQIPQLRSGETAEFYVWRPVDRFVTPCPGNEQSFVIQARGLQHHAVARAQIDLIARDEGGVNAVLIEAVERSRDSVRPFSPTSPIVDVANAEKRTVIGGVEVGGERVYYVRVTNGASWSNWTDGDGDTHAPDVHVTLQGVDKELGWNVSLRQVVRDDLMQDYFRHPNQSELWLHNVREDGRREGWVDHELEVVVTAPDVENQTALAGETSEFTIQAAINGSSKVSLLEVKTVISEVANIELDMGDPTFFAHPGERGAKLLYVYNNGSSPAQVTVHANVVRDQTTNDGNGWDVVPSSLTFPLAAFKNRTVAIQVTPPSGVAPGSRGVINITAEYAPNPIEPTRTVNETLRLTTDVIARGDLDLQAPTSEVTIAPGGFANFTMDLRNTAGGVKDVRYVLSASPIPNWTTTLSPVSGVISAGDDETVVLVLRAPTDVINDSRFETIVRVEEENNGANFDSVPLSINILGGKAIPALTAPKMEKTVDRGGTRYYEVLVKNLGTAAGTMPLEVRTTDPNWGVGIQDAAGNAISSVTLGPNELERVNVSVRAPLEGVPENTIVPVELLALTPDRSQSAKLTLQARIHDYGVSMRLDPEFIDDALPGVPVETLIRLRNTGNDNDTINASAILRDLPGWTVTLSQPEVFLEPDREATIRATILSPTSPLPSPRSYAFTIYAASRGAESVNISMNDTAQLLVSIPNYRNLDVDDDGFVEVAVDLDRDSSNGFEAFREIFSDGLQTSVVAESLLDGRTRFFLDVPRDQPHDGVADVWFDPETVYAYPIVHTPDLNFDGAPDYLLDIDRDFEGEIDRAYDTVAERYWTAVEIKMYNDDRKQFLVDTTGDGRPDRFYDPEKDVVTRTQTSSNLGAQYIGMDTDDDGRVDKYYNVETEEVSAAQVSNFADFAMKYWYFFAAFLVFAAITVALLVGRMRRA